MCSSYVVITWNLGHIDSVATTIGWARWLGEGENQVFPTHFPVQPYYRCIEIHFDCSVPFCVGCTTSNNNNSWIVSVTDSYILPGLRHPRGPAWAKHSCIHHWLCSSWTGEWLMILFWVLPVSILMS